MKLREILLWIGLLIVCVLLGYALGHAQDKKLTEISRLRVVNAYQKALLAQTAKQAADQKLNDAVKEYNDAVTAALTENHLAPGTRLQPNVDTGEVQVIEVPPAPKPTTAKPEEKKP